MKVLVSTEINSIFGGNDNNAQNVIVVQNKYADCQAMEYVALSGSIALLGTIGALSGGLIGAANGIGGAIGGSVIGGVFGAYTGVYVGLATALFAGLNCRATVLSNNS